MEEKKKKSTGLIVLVVILLVVCVAMGTFIFMNKDKFISTNNSSGEISKKEVNKNNCKEQKVYDVTDEKVNNLVKKLITGTGFNCAGLEVFANDKKVNASDINNDIAYGMVMYSSTGWQSKDTYTVDEMTKMIQKILGKDYKFDPSKLTSKKGSCISHYYDSESKTFIAQETACGGTCGPHTVGQIVKAVETDGVMEIEEKVLFVDKDITGFYTDYAKTNKLRGIEDASTFEYEKGSKYKFTFKNEDGNYVFVSSEPVK